MKFLTKLLWANNNKTSIILSSFGLLIGYFIVLISINISLIVNNTIKGDETLFSKDFLVINKKVSFLNTLSMVKSDFTKNEIQDLKKQSFVRDLFPFVSNTFKIGAYTEATQDIPGFYTELFFQAIPSSFLNIKDKRWKWEEGQTEIPIIFPGDYLKLYNFGFAKSQGLPQISAETIGKVSFNVKIEGNGGGIILRARIIGLTDKVNSILVPEKFMDWANSNYGKRDESTGSSMLLIETNNSSNPEIFSYLKEKSYETNKERIKNSKTSVFLKIIFSIALAIGLIITLLSLLLFVLSLNLIIVKSRNEIKKLFQIGYHVRQLLLFYGSLLGIIMVIINIISLLLIYFGISIFSSTLSAAGFQTNSSDFLINFIFAFGLTIIVYSINILSLRYQLRRIN